MQTLYKAMTGRRTQTVSTLALLALGACGGGGGTGGSQPPTPPPIGPIATPTPSPTSAPQYQSFTIPDGTDTRPVAITTGPDGALWFAEAQFNRIERITTSGQFTASFQAPEQAPASTISGLVTGPDGAIWYTVTGASNHIGRLDLTSGKFSSIDVGASHLPTKIIVGPDSNLWFADGAVDVGTLPASVLGVPTYFPLPPNDFAPVSIALGSDRNIWVAEASGTVTNQPSHIAALSPSGTIVQHVPLDNGETNGTDITPGPDGNMWVSQFSGQAISAVGILTKIGLTGQIISNFAIPRSPDFVPPAPEYPRSIRSASDGNLYATAGTNPGPLHSNAIERVSTSGIITRVDIPDDGSDMAIGPDGNVWVTCLLSNKIGMFKIH